MIKDMIKMLVGSAFLWFCYKIHFFLLSDFCDEQIIGTESFKGVYTFPVSPAGSVIKHSCAYGMMSNTSVEFSTTCQSGGGGWSAQDLSECLAKSKTTKDLLNLQVSDKKKTF